jgi:hypothetical protein
MDSREQAILKTLLYADIFDFPLTKQEIYSFLISDKKDQINLIYQSLKNPKLPIKFKNNFFFLKGKEGLVKKRLERQKISKEKLKKAKKIINTISFIPSVMFVGISGGLSMKNADKKDDIDIFVITKKNLLWITRFMLIVLLNILGVYRRRNSKDLKDRICLNMLIDEESIHFDKGKQNLYLAHEIAQLIPIVDKESTYKNFILSNSWINEFLPNISFGKIIYSKKKKNIFDALFVSLLNSLFLEKILKLIQFSYMKKHITKETVTQKYLAFHPFDYKSYVLASYKKKLKEFGLK